ncbi:MAG TPA: hypothetical protein VFN84_04035, partial [Pseudolabrys sp.]|nr:hypothetical protein [Pseudolabrys sp.]
GTAFHDQFDMVGIHFPQNVRRVASTDLSSGEFVDDAIARRNLRADRAIAVAGHVGIAVGALISDEIDDPFADAVDRAFFRICALDRIDLCHCRHGKDAQEYCSRDGAHGRRVASAAAKIKRGYPQMLNGVQRDLAFINS